MYRISIQDRRDRLARRHYLSSSATTVEQASAALVGFHASDPVSVYLGAKARVQDFSRSDLEGALYDHRTLLRMLGMRRTMFVVPRDLAGIVNSACTQHLLAAQQRRVVGFIEQNDVAPDGATWLDDVQARTLAALTSMGEATARQLSEVVPELATKVPYGDGQIGMSTRVLFLLATSGEIVRSRPLGSWLSSQYRWTPLHHWIPGGIDHHDTDNARRELVSRWLAQYGPGTLTDIKWWTGWGVGATRTALADCGAVEVDLDGQVGFVLPDDLEPEQPTQSWVSFLPSLDSTVMGWKERDWYLGEYQPMLFDQNGNAGPTIWCDGRIVGGWAQAKDGEIRYELLEEVDAQEVMETQAGQIEHWLGEFRITPRFRTPLEKRLRG